MRSKPQTSNEQQLAISAARFITSRGPAIHPALSGSSHYDSEFGRFKPTEPFSPLERLLRRYLPDHFGIKFEDDAARLTEISERLSSIEDGFVAGKSGFWHSLWGHLGDGNWALDGWIALIPNDYGLAVVKTGLAVVFKLAEKSAAKRAKIMQAFTDIRDALLRADPKKRSFRGNRDTSLQAESLTQTIVDSIEDMIILTTKDKRSWMSKLSSIPKFQQKSPPPDLEQILSNIKESTEEFERTVNLVRDRTIEVTGFMAQSMTSQLSVVQGDVLDARDTLETFIEQGDRQRKDYAVLCKDIHSALHQIAERENALQSNQIDARNGLMGVLTDLVRQGELHRIEIKRLQKQLERSTGPSDLIAEDDLFQILLTAYTHVSELEPFLQQPNKDLNRVLTNKNKHSDDTQVEIQTLLLRHERTVQWIGGVTSDLILVDAHQYNANMPKISAASVFSASLLTTLLSTSPGAIAVHYFCGVHSLQRDEWYGPRGLIRFITMQLLLWLKAHQRIDLTFIDSDEFLQDLESHDMSSLCHLLHSIITQFPEDLTIWLLVDSIQHLDKPGLFADLEFIMDFFRYLVNDTMLGPAVKIFITNPNHSKKSLTQLPVFQADTTRHISLRPTGAHTTKRLSDRAFGDQVSRALSNYGSDDGDEY